LRIVHGTSSTTITASVAAPSGAPRADRHQPGGQDREHEHERVRPDHQRDPGQQPEQQGALERRLAIEADEQDQQDGGDRDRLREQQHRVLPGERIDGDHEGGGQRDARVGEQAPREQPGQRDGGRRQQRLDELELGRARADQRVDGADEQRVARGLPERGVRVAVRRGAPQPVAVPGEPAGRVVVELVVDERVVADEQHVGDPHGQPERDRAQKQLQLAAARRPCRAEIQTFNGCNRPHRTAP
jgi:hypothetical protein